MFWLQFHRRTRDQLNYYDDQEFKYYDDLKFKSDDRTRKHKLANEAEAHEHYHKTIVLEPHVPARTSHFTAWICEQEKHIVGQCELEKTCCMQITCSARTGVESPVLSAKAELSKDSDAMESGTKVASQRLDVMRQVLLPVPGAVPVVVERTEQATQS